MTAKVSLKYIPFYFQKFLSSLDVKAMNTREIGAYILLLINSIDQPLPGYMDTDEEGLMNIAKLTPEQWSKDRTRILKKFRHNENGYFNSAMVNAINQTLFKISQEASANGITDAPDNPTLTPERGVTIHPLQEYVDKHLTNVKKIYNQLTFSQCEKLLSFHKFSKELIVNKLKKMENVYGIHTKVNYVYSTLVEWCEKEIRR